MYSKWSYSFFQNYHFRRRTGGQQSVHLIWPETSLLWSCVQVQVYSKWSCPSFQNYHFRRRTRGAAICAFNLTRNFVTVTIMFPGTCVFKMKLPFFSELPLQKAHKGAAICAFNLTRNFVTVIIMCPGTGVFKMKLFLFSELPLQKAYRGQQFVLLITQNIQTQFYSLLICLSLRSLTSGCFNFVASRAEVKLKRIYSPCISLNCWLPARLTLKLVGRLLTLSYDVHASRK